MLLETDTGTPARVDPVAVGEQRGTLGAGRAHRPRAGRAERHPSRAVQASSKGLPNYRLVRYADDWCLLVADTKADAEALREEITDVLAPMGLRLSQAKTLITHIDEGLDFLGATRGRTVRASALIGGLGLMTAA